MFRLAPRKVRVVSKFIGVPMERFQHFLSSISRFSTAQCTQWYGALLAAFLLCIAAVTVPAQQQNVAEASDSLTGFWLKKVVSNTQIPSGVTFSYTIYFSFPAGTQNVTITDVLPPAVVFQSISVTPGCSGTPTISTPPAGMNGTVQVSWGPQPNGCSGSLTIVVSFPNGITCNQAAARNRACLFGTVIINGQQITREFCTPYVTTIAQAASTWSVQKQLLGAAHVGGSCPYRFLGDTATYVIKVTNNPGSWGWNGQINLVNGTVTDVLPAGAQFVSATCGSYNSGTNTFTWAVGNLSATTPYNTQTCTLTVYYPPGSFPANSQITNTVTLSGQSGSAQAPCGPISETSSICWQKSPLPPPDTTVKLQKWVSTNGQPGCSGWYRIRVCNTGQTTISSLTITDTLPSDVSFAGFGYTHPGLSVSQTGGVIIATLSSPLAAGQCRWFQVNFTISPSATPNSTITNCAWLQVPGLALQQACTQFVVNAPAPKACIGKEICSPQASYSLGQIIRVRFRLQNIGGQAITGATLTDNLNPNFEYVGNPSFYTSSAWNTPCNPSGSSAWTPAPTLSVSGQTITISNITIPASCQDLFWNGCGYYGNTGVPFYWVEFDVKIRDTAALGNIPNAYTLSGGGLPQPVQSNTVFVLVTGNVGFTLDKQVASDTTNWQSSLTSSAGATVNYRLKMNLATGSVPLRHVTFVDLLPMNSSPSDGKILQACASRSSQYDATYQALLWSSPVAPALYTNNAALASANAISTATGAPSLFPTSCGTAGTWASGLAAGAKNLGFYFSQAVGASSPPTLYVGATLSNNAQPGQIACNTFAAGGAVRHYLNSSTVQDIAVGALESAPACVMIDTSSRCYGVQPHGTPQPIGVVSTAAGDACKYRLVVAINNPGPATQGCVSSAEGQVTPSSFTVPTGTSTLTLTFVDTPPQNNVACFVFGVQDAAGACKPCDTVCVDMPPCPKQDTCCIQRSRVSVKCIGRDSAGNMTYSIVASGAIPCKGSLIINSPEGTFSPTNFNIGPGIFTVSTTFTDLPPAAPGVITVYYTVVGSGVVLCRDSARIQLPPCPTQPRNCCEGWQRGIQSTVKWFSNGTVVINGTATAGPAPIHRFGAAIVSAQLKRWCPIIPPPPSSWQRIFGDITSGWLTPAPGAPQMLTPYTRQILWEGPIPDSCVNWATAPASFNLTLRFPPVSGFMCGDSLRFTVRYTFTDCDCRTCDTLITYTVVRKKVIKYPWDAIAVTRLSETQVAIDIPGSVAVSDDSTQQVTLQSLTFRTRRDTSRVGGSGEFEGLPMPLVSTGTSDWEPCDDCYTQITKDGFVVLFPKVVQRTPYNAAQNSYRIIIDEGLPDTVDRSAVIELGWEETDLQTGESQSATEERSITIPGWRGERPHPTGTLVQDRESMPPHVRTFALAFVNGDRPAQGVQIELRALPQPDGTAPNILAIGPIDDARLVIKCNSTPPVRCHGVIDDALAPGEIFRPLYMTVAGSKRDGMDAIEVEYTLRDQDGTVIGRGRVLLEGAVSQIAEPGNEFGDVGSVRIGSIIPNPASESVTVALHSVGTASNVEVALYDGLGRLVRTLLHGATLPDGTTALPVNVADLPSGVYTVLVRTAQGTAAQRLVVTR